MSVTFSSSTLTVPQRWRISCAFATETFETFAAASAAAAAHGSGGCAEAHAWAQRLRVDPSDEDLAAEDAIRDATGYWPEYCIDRCGADPWDDQRSPEVNMANTNAAEVIAALGFVDEHGRPLMAGSASPDDVEARALVALALVDDPGRAGLVDAAPGRATLIDYGRAPGYVTAKLSAILDVAHAAAQRGEQVQWG